jgi:flagellum-specific peptidoglycan hydrolase FlgJ
MYNTVSLVKSRTAELLQGRGLNDIQIKVLSDNIARQAYHETGGFKSTIFNDNRNLFGMKQSSRDYDKGVLHGHAVFNSYDDSIRDLLAYMAARKGGIEGFVLDLESYAKHLKDLGYYEDTVKNYLKGLKHAR